MSSSESFLVDFTVAIVKRRKLFCAIFALLFIVGVGYQLMVAPTYQYVTLIKLAQNGEGNLLESSKGVITTIESKWLPQIGREFRDELGHTPDFSIDVTEVADSYVLLSSVGDLSDGEDIAWIHSEIANKVEESQSVLENVARKKLQAQIEIAEQAVENSQGASGPDSSGSGLAETLVLLKGRLTGMQPADTRVIAQQKDKSLGLALPTRIALTFLQAFVAAVIAVLLYYFVKQVSNVLGSPEKQR